MLVGPCSLQAGGVGNAEDRVDLEKIVRKYLGAAAIGAALLRQIGRVYAAAEQFG